jgi:hypothetical protein
MVTVAAFETLEFCFKMTQLAAREDFVTFGLSMGHNLYYFLRVFLYLVLSSLFPFLQSL